MKYWFDTEFIENGTTIDLMSIGVISEDGRTFYAEPLECQLYRAGDWVKANVIPHLTGNKTPRAEIAKQLVEFVGEKPEIWAYYADYDWVALCQLFGTMMQLPKGWPMYCRDVKQLCDSLGNPKLPEQTSTEHNALADAEWCREAWVFLTAEAPTQTDEDCAREIMQACITMHDGKSNPAIAAILCRHRTQAATGCQRLCAALEESYVDNLTNAVHEGLESNKGFWWPGGMSDAEWAERMINPDEKELSMAQMLDLVAGTAKRMVAELAAPKGEEV